MVSVRYAVSHINFHDNNLETIIVIAPTWEDALLNAFPETYNEEWLDNVLLTATNYPCANTFISDLEIAKKAAFDINCTFDITEIPKELQYGWLLR